MSKLRRLLARPSSRLIRAIVIPLSIIQLLATLYLGLLSQRAAENLAYDRIEGMAQAWAMTDLPGSEALSRTADWIGADRIWVISATGRILASNRQAEVDGLVDDIWWQDLPPDVRRIRREKAWGGLDYVQVAYHDIERGTWAMVIADLDKPVLAGSARLAAVLLLSLCIWLMLVGTVVLAVRRTLGRALDISDLVARRALEGTAASAASLARLRASVAGYGPAQLLLQLVDRMQERASRANEAESRFSLAVELLPGLAYLADYEGNLLFAGPALRSHLDEGRLAGQRVFDVAPDLQLPRVHKAALESRKRGVTFDQLPVREADAEAAGLVASVRSVVFRGAPAYLAHLESVSEFGQEARHEKAARRSTALEREVIDQIQDLVIVFDGAARTLLWNDAARQFTGVDADGVPDLRRAIGHLFTRKDAVDDFARWMDASPESAPLVVRSQAADQREVSIEWTASEVKVAGRTVGGALFGRILPEAGTDRVASMTARRERRRRLRARIRKD